MVTMIERVAAAMVAAMAKSDEGAWIGPLNGDEITNARIDGQFDMIAVACAAIEEMREPTEAMKAECEGWRASASDMAGCYRAMIDAALEETPSQVP